MAKKEEEEEKELEVKEVPKKKSKKVTKTKKALKEASRDAIDRKQDMLNVQANFKKKKEIRKQRKAKLTEASQQVVVRVGGKTKQRG